MALCVAQTQQAPGIMCLRNLNGYVSAALASWAKNGTAPAVLRERAPGAWHCKEQSMAGGHTVATFCVSQGRCKSSECLVREDFMTKRCILMLATGEMLFVCRNQFLWHEWGERAYSAKPHCRD